MKQWFFVSIFFLLGFSCVDNPDGSRPGASDQGNDASPSTDVGADGGGDRECVTRLIGADDAEPSPGGTKVFNGTGNVLTIDLIRREFSVQPNEVVSLDLVPGDHLLRARTAEHEGEIRYDVAEGVAQTLWITRPEGESCLVGKRVLKRPKAGMWAVNLTEQDLQIARKSQPYDAVRRGEAGDFFPSVGVEKEVELLIAWPGREDDPVHFIENFEEPTVSFLVGTKDDGYVLLHDDGRMTENPLELTVVQFQNYPDAAYDICFGAVCSTRWIPWGQPEVLSHVPARDPSIVDAAGNPLQDWTRRPLDTLLMSYSAFLFGAEPHGAFTRVDPLPLATMSGSGSDEEWAVLNLTDVRLHVGRDAADPVVIPPDATPFEPGELRTMRFGGVMAVFPPGSGTVDAWSRITIPEDWRRGALIAFRHPGTGEIRLGLYSSWGLLWDGSVQADERCDATARCAAGFGCLTDDEYGTGPGVCRPVCKSHLDCADDQVCGTAAYASLDWTGALCHVDEEVLGTFYVDDQNRQRVEVRWPELGLVSDYPVRFERSYGLGPTGGVLMIIDSYYGGSLNLSVGALDDVGSYDVFGRGVEMHFSGPGWVAFIDARGQLDVESYSEVENDPSSYSELEKEPRIEGELQLYVAKSPFETPPQP